MPEIYDWEREGSFIYDWEAALQDEKLNLMLASQYNWAVGTVLYAGAAIMAVDADLSFLKVAHASGAPSKATLLELVASAGSAWVGRRWRSEAHEQHVEAYELV